MLKKIVHFIVCWILIFLNVLLAEGSEITPFYTQNQSPLISVYGLPGMGSAVVKAAKEGSLRLILDTANNYVAAGNKGENIVLDGETMRLTLSGRYGIGRKMELGLDVPFLITGGGFLDGFIEKYHSTFGFPNGGRELASQNRLLFRYQKNGVTLLNMEQSGQGLGDVRIAGGWQVYQSARGDRNLMLKAGIKLPTGDTESMRGSGSFDGALWLVGNIEYQMPFGQLSLFGQAGAMGMTKGKILPDQQRPAVGFGAFGLGVRPAEWLELKIQTNASTSFYSESDLSEVSAPSAQLTIGGTLRFSPKTSLDLAVTEDIIVGASPDVVFHLSLAHKF
jgi:hypothetical protein